VTRLGVFEDSAHADLAPLTHLRPTFLLWSGLAPAWQRLEALYGVSISIARCRASLTRVAAREIAPLGEATGDEDAVPPTAPLAERAATAAPPARLGNGASDATALLVNGALWPTLELPSEIPLEGPDEIFASDGRIAAVRLSRERLVALGVLENAPFPETLDAGALPAPLANLPVRETAASFVRHPWDLVADNESRLREDFQIFAKLIEARRIAKASEIGVDFFVGDGATLSSKASLDASDGPILIGAGVTVEPFAFIQGPAFIGAGARVRAGCRVEGGSTIAPGCRIGGEVEASILHPFVNKQHDGFLGHSIVGSWTNLGAGSITSDLKNTYGTVRSFAGSERVDTGLTKLGAIIGEHAKIGIGTLLSAGTVVGTAAQIAGVPGVVSGAVPRFAWWAGEERAAHDVERAIETARTVLGRRGRTLEPDEENLLRALFEDRESAGERDRWIGAARERR
jgi:UDP-N-acetylglucosamine diphosphorylase / glucose-1-phosphate thymidylyltransferase / UDP-N-acetylgalactosamine diphosphorylase / glucosamine-1-phosphate N-acetyltransferase / galactosamine-1-phosphate N-acetyltransferase